MCHFKGCFTPLLCVETLNVMGCIKLQRSGNNSASRHTFLNLATRSVYIFIVLLHLLLYLCTVALSPCKRHPVSYRDNDDDDDQH